MDIDKDAKWSIHVFVHHAQQGRIGRSCHAKDLQVLTYILRYSLVNERFYLYYVYLNVISFQLETVITCLKHQSMLFHNVINAYLILEISWH